MAPVGNLATFHGIPNTTGLPNLFEMPKLTANVSMTPSHNQPMNSFQRFPLDVPQSSHQPNPTTSTFLPANFLMSCNLSFLTPQQLAAFYTLQIQNQQQQMNQQSPPANNFLNPMNVGMVAQFMPAFVQQPFFGNLPMATLPLIQTPNQLFQQQYLQNQQNQMVSKAEQTPPTSSFLHSSSFFQTPTSSNISPTTPNLQNIFPSNYQNLIPTNTFTLVSNPSRPETSNQQKEQSHDQRVSPPTIRPDSSEFNDLSDSNMPPMLQPELPCLMEYTDSDDFSAPPELLPDHCMFDDECGPPRLEPQVPIPTTSESDQQEDFFKSEFPTNPMSPPSTDLSPTKQNNNNNEHPLFEPILTAMLKNATTLSSPKFNSPIPIDSMSRKRERSASTDSSDLMLKMPKLVSMIEEAEIKVEEQKIEETIPEQQVESTIEQADERENTTPFSLVEEPIEEEPIEECVNEVEESIEESIEEPEEKPIESLIVSVDNHNTSIASSSGVSSANSSLLAEEPIIIRFKRPTIEAVKEIQEEREKTPCSDIDQEEDSPAPSPLTALQNTKLRSRQQQNSKSRKSSKQVKIRKPLAFPDYYFATGKRRSGHKKQKGVEIHSNWRPVGEEEIREVRLNAENQYQKRRCFQAIRHMREKDEIIRVRDCVKVKSSEGLENIGKVMQIFLDEPSASICIQVLWYYTQAQTSKDIVLNEKELLASRHCDVINSDSIEEHAYVLTYAEYCRFIAETRIDELPPNQRPLESDEIMSRGDENYGRRIRLPHEDSPIDLVYWCSRTFSIKTKKICLSATTSRRGSRHNHGRKLTRSNRS